MKMKPRFLSLLAVLLASAPLLSASEVERLRALVAEQEMQIQQLELKVAELSHSPTKAIPTSTTETRPVPLAETCPESAATENPSTYTVVAGDNIVIIARKHGTTSAILNKLNGLKTGDIIRPGQKIKLPSESITASTVATEPAPPVATPVATPIPTSTVKHKVAEKETFYSISKKYGVSVDALIEANPSINPRTLRIGKVVQIPSNQEVSNQTPVPGPENLPALSNYSNIPVSSQSSTASQPRESDKPVKITKEISYSDFAKTYNTTPERLDQINGLRLDPTTILAQGSELYIPKQP